MEIYSILVLITFKSAFAGEETSNCKSIKESMKIANTTEEFISNTVKYLCPAEKGTDIKNLNKIPSEFYEMKYCLYDKTFQGDGPLECEADVKPIFVLYYDKDKPGTLQCGLKETQKLYTFGYYRCGDGWILNELKKEEVQKDPKKLGNFAINTWIYEICYDQDEMRTLWTKHTIQHPALFKDKNFEDNEFYCPPEISTDPFFMDANLFVKLKQKYEAEDKGKSHKIIAHHLVPLEHLALRVWKKTANHFLNTAPLREHFNPYMRAINEGIKRAAQKIYFESNETINDFLIFTKVTSSTESYYAKIKKALHFKISESNIWYKIVYSVTKKTALMIVLHNSDEKPWKKKCKKMTCDFTKWTEEDTLRSSMNLKKKGYAYCCQITSKQAEEVFSIRFTIEGYLDINAMLIPKDKKR